MGDFADDSSDGIEVGAREKIANWSDEDTALTTGGFGWKG